jgi:hypothetical protein
MSMQVAVEKAMYMKRNAVNDASDTRLSEKA